MQTAYIEIFFENCEVAHIKSEYIYKLYMDGFGFVMYQDILNNHTHELLLQIDNKAKVTHNDGFTEEGDNGKAFEDWQYRLTSGDVVGITIGYKSGQCQTFYVDWSNTDDSLDIFEQKNRYQKCIPGEKVCTLIVSKTKKGIEDYDE